MLTAHAVLEFLAQGLLAWGAWPILAYTLASTHLTIIAVTIWLHRCQAHRALELHPAVSHLFRLWLWLSTGMVTREWVAVHRKHHAYCERDGDPHSPHVFGIGTVLLRGSELYRGQIRDAAALARFGRGTRDDWLERHVYGVMPWQGVGALLVLDVALFGVIGLTVWAVQMLWIPVTAAGIVNGLGHYWGYRNFDGPSAAANLLPLGIIIGGEELHGNHHAFPASARLSVRWFECDIGWVYIRILAWAGLARVRSAAARAPARRHTGAAVTQDTVGGVSGQRQHVMRAYGTLLVLVFRAELRRSGVPATRGARRAAEILLRRQPEYMSERQRLQLASLSAQHPALARTLAMGQELRAVWQDPACCPVEALRRLRTWCHDANATGIPALASFARRLPIYDMPTRAAAATP